jgi:hypothetical protein
MTLLIEADRPRTWGDLERARRGRRRAALSPPCTGGCPWPTSPPFSSGTSDRVTNPCLPGPDRAHEALGPPLSEAVADSVLGDFKQRAEVCGGRDAMFDEGVDDVSVVIGEEVSHDEDFRRKKELP